MKEYIWFISVSILCLLTGIVMLTTSTTSWEPIVGGVLAGLSLIVAFWIGLRRGKEIAKYKNEQTNS